MSSILYLIRKNIKNTLIEMLHKPVKLILYLFIFLMLGVSIFSGQHVERQDFMDARILELGYFVILAFLCVLTVWSGLKSGATFFKMSDVNLLFVSPVSPKTILAYGLIKQMGASALAVFFLLFYGSMIRSTFNIEWAGVALMVAGLALTLFLSQVLALLIYSFSNGSPARVRAVKGVIYVFLLLSVAIVGFVYLSGGSTLGALMEAAGSPLLELVPVFGWVKGAVFGCLTGDYASAAAFAAVTLLCAGCSVFIFLKSDADYYEDVLQHTETQYELQRATKEGRTADVLEMKTNKGIKVRDRGIKKGWGADTFFFKHLCEAKRRSRIPFLNTSTVMILAVDLILTFFLARNSSSEDGMFGASGFFLMIALIVNVYILFFLNASGDWTRELLKPYIYLTPEPPFQKLLWASMTTVLKPAIDGVIVFALLAVFLRANPFTAVISMLIYASFGLLYTACNILSERVFGQMANKGLIVMLYLLMVLLIALPGGLVSIVLLIDCSFLPAFVIGLPVAGWNLLVSIGLIAACRNILGNMEMQG